MPGTEKNSAHSGPFAKNGRTALLLLVGIITVITALYAGQYFFFRQQNQSPQRSGLALHRITGITRDDVFDLSGSEASGAGDPMKLFDENADPANGPLTHPNSNPLPNPKMGIFYPPGKGLRIVADLHHLYKFSNFYMYDKAFAADSVWLYTGEMNNWKLVAAFATAGNAAAWGWKNFTVAQTSRYVMIRFNSYKSVVSELVMYGDIKQKLPADKPMQLGPLPAPVLRQFAGTNAYDYVPPRLLQPFQQTRLYQMMDYFDVDTVNAYPNNKLSLNALRQPQQQQVRYYADSLRRLGNYLWMSIRGMPTYLQRKGFNEKDKPVTVPGMDTEDPLSYGRHAKTFWNMAALFGKTRVDTNLIDVNDMPRFSGLGLMDRFENGNEEDGYWTQYYWTPADYFAVSTADYDGHEGRMGKKHGLHQADIYSRLMTSGMIQLDTNRVKTLYFLCRELRKDKKFIWEGGVQYHYYSNAVPNNLQSPTRGISPEADHMREKLVKVRAFHDRLLPGIPLILGENGYDRNQHSWQRTPLLPGYDEAQSQGIMCIRSLLAAFMAGFDGYNQYMMRSATNDENAQGPYATSGMIGGPANKLIYPVWYYWSTYMQQLGNYQADGVVTESGPVWVYRFKNRQEPAKKAYVLFSPTTNGSIIKNFNFNSKNFDNQDFNEVRLADKNAGGSVKKGRFVDGVATLDVGESPVILLMD
ncbi:MAG: hypothetical protein ABIQ88_02230 [Chitinophagaceae bacterium]